MRLVSNVTTEANDRTLLLVVKWKKKSSSSKFFSKKVKNEFGFNKKPALCT